MPLPNLNDLAAFVAVGAEQSFTRAAAKLGVTPSALSHTVRGLEERLGVRLLARTTRSVAPTEAGQRLLASLAPMLDEIQAQIAALSDLRDRPSGTVRITADEHAQETLLWPRLRPVLRDYPDIQLELITDYGLSDIVAERYDAGVRLGELVAKDMIAVPIGPSMRMAVVASPGYLEAHGTPAAPSDLTRHRCINLRLPTHGGLYAWEFEDGGRDIQVRVAGQVTFNSIHPMLEAALDGFGLAYLTATMVQPLVDQGRLVSVLSEWLPPFSGYHLYYPSRRQMTPAFRLVVDTLRYSGQSVF
ncbi:LysR family transcriptional regulator [Luteibacter sp. 22Crub2.1]|uniref:LysR family transcriptional regulator n=1 Tax=Luteibacter sp. 22Crub2.1 TaxID=1283288 RepID=UPI0009A7AF20|nr:LysR family transcriptional regulator [Luteibacter sp. 22Crub2.1]SKB27842.1 DNA-binding transcriptional regulator, LysR family [Luteibacter sp. 22Crub2.1]